MQGMSGGTANVIKRVKDLEGRTKKITEKLLDDYLRLLNSMLRYNW